MRRLAGDIEGYYRLHTRIYDATRWSFLFGRDAILDRIPGSPRRILEVGCGTGRNLVRLCRRFPRASVAGLDAAGAMLDIARRAAAPFGSRVDLRHGRYEAPVGGRDGFDLVLFSYALSMFNPGFEAARETARADLAPGGHVAVVDFHATRSAAFERWMAFNHVRMNGQLRPVLRATFPPPARTPSIPPTRASGTTSSSSATAPDPGGSTNLEFRSTKQIRSPKPESTKQPASFGVSGLSLLRASFVLRNDKVDSRRKQR
jgi:S-adenosylmethionine-diacylgycerolhomoserine-N-methlytransferase